MFENTPVLVNCKEVKPIILILFGSKHGNLLVDKHPVQALIRDRTLTCIHTKFRYNIDENLTNRNQ